jgi:hypothetical protein
VLRYAARPPTPTLAKLVEYVWSSQGAPAHAQERVVPTGTLDVLPAAELPGARPPRWTLTVDPVVTVRIRDHIHGGLAATVPIAGALSAVPAIGLVLAGAW